MDFSSPSAQACLAKQFSDDEEIRVGDRQPGGERGELHRTAGGRYLVATLDAGLVMTNADFFIV